MGQPIYINADSSNLLSARVRGANDLRSQGFTQFIAGDSLELDLYLVNSSGLLNIQDYAEIRVGMGNLDSRPDSGDYLVGGTDTLVYNHTAADLKTVIDSQVAVATVTMLADFVFKVQFDAVGAQTIPSLDFTDLQPGSTVSVTRLTTGDSVTRESWLWRIYRNPIAFTNVFTSIADSGVRGTLSLATSGIYDLLAQSEEVNTFFEVELTDTTGNVRTFLQSKVKLKGEVIGHNFSGSIPTSPTNSPEANAFLESFPNPEISGDLTVAGKITTPEIITAVTGNTSEDLLISTPDGIGLSSGGDITIRAGVGGNINLESRPLEGGGSISINAGDGGLSVNSVANFGSILSIDNNGLTVGNGYGLQFTSAGKSLRDYQYGSFTPVLHLNGTTEQSSYAIQEGYYVKIGRLVSVNVSIKVTNFDTAFKTAPNGAEIGIKGLPHSAKIEGADGPDTMIVRVHPKKGWIQLGANSYNGAVGSSPDGLIYFEKNVGQGDTAAGEAWNYARIKVGDFNVHPFNFTADGVKAFTFQVSGAYITDDDI